MVEYMINEGTGFSETWLDDDNDFKYGSGTTLVPFFSRGR